MYTIKSAFAFLIAEDPGAIIGAVCVFAIPAAGLFIGYAVR